MSKTKFVVLPTIKSFAVINYPMFTKDWDYKVLSGLNLIIGVNGIGKTTTTNLLSYGLVGSHKGFHEELNPEYFMHRLANSDDLTGLDGEQTPRVALELIIGTNTIFMTRSLIRDEVLSLTINKAKVTYNEKITDRYVKAIKEFTALESLDDLTFLISHLLIREEEHNYLLWDEKHQSKVIRLLLNPIGFADEYKNLERELQDADSEYKREKDFMGKLEKLRKSLIDVRDKELATKTEYIKKEDILKEIEKSKQDRNLTILEKDALFLRSTQLNEQVKNNEIQLSSFRAEYETSADELKALESRHYHSSFEDSKSEFIFTKISQRNICIVCNSSVTDKKVSEVVKKVRNQHECPVCSSGLVNVDETQPALSARDIKRMEHLEVLVKQRTTDIAKAQKLSEQLFLELDENSRKLSNSETKLRELNLKIALNQNKLEKLVGATNENFTSVDFRIADLEKEIEAYREVTEPLLKKYNQVKEKMRKKNEVLNTTIDKFNDELVKIFGALAKTYFADKCTLVIDKRQPKGFEIQLSYFIPNLEGKPRKASATVSKSEAIFLEYLFRFAILKLYLEKTGIKPFLFLETSEGSFDVNNTVVMAETLAQIGKIGFPFVIITNLSKIDFIENLIPDVPERKKRTFNLIQLAPSSVFAGKKNNAVDKALKELKLA